MYRLLTEEGLYRIVAERVQTESSAIAILIYIGFLALVIIGSYLIGGFNAAIFLSRTVYHDDIHNHGSGNAGTTNMLRTFGWRAALATLALDAVKTAVAILYAWVMMGGVWVGYGFSFSPGAYLAMLFCILGHIYPVFYKFKGGKGILCASVSIAMLSPIVFGVLVIVFAGTVAFTKYVSLGSILSAACYPLFLNSLVRAMFGGVSLPAEILIPSFLIMGLLIYSHRSNIKRLYNHRENRLSFRRRSQDSAENYGATPSDEED